MSNASSPPGVNSQPFQVASPSSVPGDHVPMAKPSISEDPWVLSPETLGDEIITLYVGKKRKKFTVHKKLLCDRCEFFSKAFSGNFQEAEKGEMHLPEDNSTTVASLVDYLYRGSLPKPSVDGDYSKALRLYWLADKICMTTLMDKCLDAIRRNAATFNIHPGPGLIKQIYSKTSSDSMIRKYYAGIVSCGIARWGKEGTRVDEFIELHANCPDFLLDVFRWQLDHGIDVAEALRKNRLIPLHEVVELFGPCEFHSHGEVETCYLKAGK